MVLLLLLMQMMPDDAEDADAAVGDYDFAAMMNYYMIRMRKTGRRQQPIAILDIAGQPD